MITGQEPPDEGTIKLGETVKLAYVDQSRDALDPNKNVWEEISGGAEVIHLGDMQMNSRVYTGRLQLQGHRPAEEGRVAVGRGAQPRPHGQAVEIGRQRVAA
jgi:ATPase subunit of ABC transporter with duplicated ATPase domains